MASEIKSVLDTLVGGTEWLEKRGVPEARRNMEYLLAHVLGLKRLDLYLQFDRPLGEGELEPLRALLRRRGAREPLQHILGSVEFCGHCFRCDARALIPRPETEELVEWLVRGPPPHTGMVLDLGCGSGVIGLSLSLAWHDSVVTLADLSKDALSLAGENASCLGVAERVRLVESDLFAGLGEQKYGVVVANLPYVTTADMVELDAEVEWDPTLALHGGVDGLDVIRRFARELSGHLEPGGRVALEVGYGQGESTAELLRGVGLGGVEWRKDLAGQDRFVFGRA